MAKYRHSDITLKDLRNDADPEGRATRAGEPLTQMEAAKALHIHQAHLSNIENGKQPASKGVLAGMRTLYGVPLTVVYAAYARTRALAPSRKATT